MKRPLHSARAAGTDSSRQLTRRDIAKAVVYVVPTIVTLEVAPAFADRGSAEGKGWPTDRDRPDLNDLYNNSGS